MNLVKVEIDVPETLLRYVDVNDAEYRKKIRELMVYELVKENKISFGKAAEMLGLSKIQFITELGKMGIAYFDMEGSEVIEDVKTIDNFFGGKKLMIVVSNTTPILSLLKIGCMNLLEEIFEEIFISEGVFSELTAKEMLSEEIKIIKECKFIKTIKVKNEFAVKLLQKEVGLDLGESESIVLANELNANVLLIDERKGRKIAQSFEINISGTLGILLKAKELNYIELIKPYLDKLIDNNIRISHNLYDEILKYAHEI